MKPLTINGSDRKVRGAVSADTSRCGFGSRASIDHHQLNSALSPHSSRASSSKGRRKLAGAHRSGPFIRVGWGIHPADLADLRRLEAAGVDSRIAVQLIAQHSGAPGQFQCFPERHSHSSSSSVSSSNASKTIGKRFADEQKSRVSGAKID